MQRQCSHLDGVRQVPRLQQRIISVIIIMSDQTTGSIIIDTSTPESASGNLDTLWMLDRHRLLKEGEHLGEHHINTTWGLVIVQSRANSWVSFPGGGCLGHQEKFLQRRQQKVVSEVESLNSLRGRPGSATSKWSRRRSETDNQQCI